MSTTSLAEVGFPVSEVFGIIVFLGLSAIFSASETALTSLNSARARQLVESGGRTATILQRWLEQPAELLTSMLIGNNIVNVAASALGTSVAHQLLGDSLGGDSQLVSPLAVAVGVMTLLLLTFGEITPKTLARAHHERIAVPALYLLMPWYYLSLPVTKAFTGLSRLVGRLTNTEVDAVTQPVSDEDIEYMVRIGREEGSISSEHSQLLRSVFDFSETTAREVMVPRTDVVSLKKTATEAEIVELVLSRGHSRLPVHDGVIDNIVGLFYAKDLLQQLREPDVSKRTEFNLEASLRPANFIPETKAISDVLREMQDNRIHMVIVVDEFGGFAGIVTLEDIIEEFFGDILDEYDKESQWLVDLGAGRWRVDARINMDDLSDALDVEIEEEGDIDTLGGYLTKELGEVPSAGEVVNAWGLTMKIEEADARRVKKVLIEHSEEPEDEAEPHA